MRKKALFWGSLTIVLAAVIVGVFYAVRPHLQPEYTNPVFQPVLADPSIIRGTDGYFYAYGTEDDWGDGHGNHLVAIIQSKDLVHWKYIRDAFTSLPTWKQGGGGIWAPDISRHKDGVYYLYYAMSTWGDENPGIGVATANSPAGPFTDHGKLFTSDGIGVQNAIDPQYFVDTDGTPYLFFGSFHGIYGVKLSSDGFHTVGKPFQIAGTDFEAPYIIRRNGYYYFFGSSGTCCDAAGSTYHVTVARAKSLKGPYVDKDGNSIMLNEGTLVVAEDSPQGTNTDFVGAGHNAVITDDHGTDWLVYHAIDVSQPTLMNGATRRPLMIDRLIWQDGWPTVKNQEPSNTPQPAPYIKH